MNIFFFIKRFPLPYRAQMRRQVFAGRAYPHIRRGFTLIEILLVLILLATIAALAIPNFRQSFSAMQLQTTAGDLEYLMRYAQSRALIQGQTVQIVFDQNSRTYRLDQMSSEQERTLGAEEDDEEERTRRIPRRFRKNFHVPAEVEWEVSVPSVKFYPDGTMDKARIRLCQKNRCQIVSTSEQRGRVFVYDEDEE